MELNCIVGRLNGFQHNIQKKTVFGVLIKKKSDYVKTVKNYFGCVRQNIKEVIKNNSFIYNHFS